MTQVTESNSKIGGDLALLDVLDDFRARAPQMIEAKAANSSFVKIFSTRVFEFLNQRSLLNESEFNLSFFYRLRDGYLPLIKPLPDFRQALSHPPRTIFSEWFSDVWNNKLDDCFNEAIFGSSKLCTVRIGTRWVIHASEIRDYWQLIQFAHELGHAYADNFLWSRKDPILHQLIYSESLALWFENFAMTRIGQYLNMGMEEILQYRRVRFQLDWSFFLYELQLMTGEGRVFPEAFILDSWLLRESFVEKDFYQAIYVMSRYLSENLLVGELCGETEIDLNIVVNHLRKNLQEALHDAGI